MIDRLGAWPEKMSADTGYGSAEMFAWLVEKAIEPSMPAFDRSRRTYGTFRREDSAVKARASRISARVPSLSSVSSTSCA